MGGHHAVSKCARGLTKLRSIALRIGQRTNPIINDSLRHLTFRYIVGLLSSLIICIFFGLLFVSRSKFIPFAPAEALVWGGMVLWFTFALPTSMARRAWLFAGQRRVRSLQERRAYDDALGASSLAIIVIQTLLAALYMLAGPRDPVILWRADMAMLFNMAFQTILYFIVVYTVFCWFYPRHKMTIILCGGASPLAGWSVLLTFHYLGLFA